MITNDDRIKIIEKFADRIDGFYIRKDTSNSDGCKTLCIDDFDKYLFIYMSFNILASPIYQLFLVRCIEWIFVNDHIDFRPIYSKYDNAWHDTILYFETPEKVLHKTSNEAREAALLWYLKQEVK